MNPDDLDKKIQEVEKKLDNIVAIMNERVVKLIKETVSEDIEQSLQGLVAATFLDKLTELTTMAKMAGMNGKILVELMRIYSDVIQLTFSEAERDSKDFFGGIEGERKV